MKAVRRSVLERWHERHGAVWMPQADARLVARYRDEKGAPGAPGLCDLSLLARTGYKGAGATQWLGGAMNLPDAPNACVAVAGGGLLARLARNEYLVIDDPDGDAGVAALLDAKFTDESPARTYWLPRADSHCLFALTGQRVPEVMAKLCGVDLRAQHFGPGALTQTSVARVSAIVARVPACDAPVFYLLADITVTEYLWGCVLDAMGEFGGRATGLEALGGILETLS